jgi:hypothetical protein
VFKKTLLAFTACAAFGAAAQSTPYAGQQARAIKSLSAQDVSELQQGQGMGLAKAAELNGYPGPAHVLEHAAALSLTAQQRDASEALMQRHKARARELGLALIEAERALDQAFATKQVDAAQLSRLTADIGVQQARLREEHLRTHLEQTALLDRQQIARYQQLRGYAAAGTEPAPAGGHHRKHH